MPHCPSNLIRRLPFGCLANHHEDSLSAWVQRRFNAAHVECLSISLRDLIWSLDSGLGHTQVLATLVFVSWGRVSPSACTIGSLCTDVDPRSIGLLSKQGGQVNSPQQEIMGLDISCCWLYQLRGAIDRPFIVLSMCPGFSRIFENVIPILFFWYGGNGFPHFCRIDSLLRHIINDLLFFWGNHLNRLVAYSINPALLISSSRLLIFFAFPASLVVHLIYFSCESWCCSLG